VAAILKNIKGACLKETCTPNSILGN